MPRDKTENHEKILAAAYDEFLEYGFNDASMRRIADACEMSASGLYKRDHADPNESFGEKGALNILPICIAPERQISRLSIKMMFSEQNNRKNRGKSFN